MAEEEEEEEENDEEEEEEENKDGGTSSCDASKEVALAVRKCFGGIIRISLW